MTTADGVPRRYLWLVVRDRLGLALFLGTLAFTLLAWRTGIVINDNVTLRATLSALADGRVWIEPATGEFLRSPGTGVRDGYVYGRNYGQLVLSLPALWALQALDAVADLHVALAAVWHLLVLAFFLQVGALTGYERPVAYGASALVLGSFLVNLLVATSFDPSLPLLALQATAAVAAALAAVAAYRLVTFQRGRRPGLLAGLGVVLATPVAFWGLVPKRHVFSVAITVGLLYAFARGRTANGRLSLPHIGSVPVYRAGAYALVGLLAWIHAEEAVYVFLALVLVDVPTAPANDRRSLAFVAGVFGLSLLPFFATNLLVAGDLTKPPRSLIGGFFETGSSVGSGGSGGRGGSTSGQSVVALVGSLLPSQAVWVVGNVWGSILDGVHGVLDPANMYRTLVHSSVESVNEDLGFRGINLSVLESAPVFGALLAAAVTGVSTAVRERLRSVDPTILLALVLATAFLLTKAGRLPLRVQITVRYLLPVYALGVVLLTHSALATWLVGKHRSLLYWSYGAGVCIGGQLLLVALVLGRFSVGEAARVHALLGVGLGLAVAVLCLAGLRDERARPAAVVAIGLAAAASTVFVLLAGLYYFSFTGDYILPAVDLLVERLSAAG
jgi:hypothetical protein